MSRYVFWGLLIFFLSFAGIIGCDQGSEDEAEETENGTVAISPLGDSDDLGDDIGPGPIPVDDDDDGLPGEQDNNPSPDNTGSQRILSGFVAVFEPDEGARMLASTTAALKESLLTGADVDLVKIFPNRDDINEREKIVASTITDAQGNYQFKDVDDAKGGNANQDDFYYEIRASKGDQLVTAPAAPDGTSNSTEVNVNNRSHIASKMLSEVVDIPGADQNKRPPVPSPGLVEATRELVVHNISQLGTSIDLPLASKSENTKITATANGISTAGGNAEKMYRANQFESELIHLKNSAASDDDYTGYLNRVIRESCGQPDINPLAVPAADKMGEEFKLGTTKYSPKNVIDAYQSVYGSSQSVENTVAQYKSVLSSIEDIFKSKASKAVSITSQQQVLLFTKRGLKSGSINQSAKVLEADQALALLMFLPSLQGGDGVMPNGTNVVEEGKIVYNEKCTSCHGADGKGVADKDLTQCTDRCETPDTLKTFIDGSMPTADPTICQAQCALEVGAYISETFISFGPDPNDPDPDPNDSGSVPINVSGPVCQFNNSIIPVIAQLTNDSSLDQPSIESYELFHGAMGWCGYSEGYGSFTAKIHVYVPQSNSSTTVSSITVTSNKGDNFELKNDDDEWKMHDPPDPNNVEPNSPSYCVKMDQENTYTITANLSSGEKIELSGIVRTHPSLTDDAAQEFYPTLWDGTMLTSMLDPPAVFTVKRPTFKWPSPADLLKGMTAVDEKKHRVKYSYSFAHFKGEYELTGHALETTNLKDEVSPTVLNGLNSIKDQRFTTKENFLNAVENAIGADQKNQYEAVILKYANAVGEAVSSDLCPRIDESGRYSVDNFIPSIDCDVEACAAATETKPDQIRCQLMLQGYVVDNHDRLMGSAAGAFSQFCVDLNNDGDCGE